MEEKFVFNNETKELFCGGECKACPSGGLGTLLFNNMKQHAANKLIAQIEAETGHKDTYQDFLNRCIRVALYMKEQGIQQGDIISICSQNNLNNCVPMIACLLIGAVVASLDPQISVQDSIHLLNLVEPKMIFVCKKSEGLIQKCFKQMDNDVSKNIKCVTLYEDQNYENLAQILEKFTEDDVKVFEPIFIEDNDSTAFILFSSGTTGLAKGTCLSHNALHSSMIDFSPEMIVFGYTTTYWFSGVLCAIIGFNSGCIKLNCMEFIPEDLWKLVEKYMVNYLYLPYSNCMDGLKYLEGSFPDLNLFFIVGGQLSQQYYNEYLKKLPETNIFVGYGMTEIGAISGKPDEYKMGSAGLPYDKELVIKIVDPETEQPVDLNEQGEIRVKGKYQMTTYYKKDSKDSWDSQGFFKTGDIGYLDDGYNLFVMDRIKEMFKYRSWHVLPAKIEKHLANHPAVLHAVVIGVPIPEMDNHAMGIVVLKNGFDVATEELVKYVNDEMDDIHQIRAGIKFIQENEIPYTATGKICRRKLRAIHAEVK